MATAEDAAKQRANDGSITGTMGRKNLIPYGCYVSHWFVSPMLADQTGFSNEDFRILADALLNMWDTDRSAARGLMATRALVAFKHSSKLGNARAHDLFDRVSVGRASDGPPRSFADYRVTVRREGLPTGIEAFELTNAADYGRLFPA